MSNTDVSSLPPTAAEAPQGASPGVPTGDMVLHSELLISGQRARIIIKNAHALLRHKFRGIALWSLVSQITGHGSGYSSQICETANLDPFQKCGPERLKDFLPNTKDEPDGHST